MLRSRNFLSPVCVPGTVAAPVFGQVSFRAQQDYRTPFPGCCSVVSGDFNGDGHLDLIASPVYYGAVGTAPLLYLQNNSDGTFTAKEIRFALATLISVLAAADVNGVSLRSLASWKGGPGELRSSAGS
jgi:hypothetical protein